VSVSVVVGRGQKREYKEQHTKLRQAFLWSRAGPFPFNGCTFCPGLDELFFRNLDQFYSRRCLGRFFIMPSLW